MRILEIISSIDPAGGGPIEGVKQLAAVNTANGHRIEVASLDAPGSPYIRSFPLPVHALGPGFLRYSYSSRLVPWLRRNAPQFDAVVINGVWQYSSFGAWRALHGGPVPYVIFTHGQLDPWFKSEYPVKHLKKRLYWPWAGYCVLRDARAVLFTCIEEKELVRQSFSPFPDNGVVVGYGTAAPRGDPQAEKEAFFAQYPELRGKRLAVFLGRLHPKKGCDLLIQAFSTVLAKDPCWRLVMAGPDETGWQSQLSAMAQQLGISDRITWTGMIGGPIKWGVLRAAEIFVLPSHSENFGISVVEALACGVPVLISARVNIWREIVEDGAGMVAPDTLAGTAQVLNDWIGLSSVAQKNMRDRTVPCFMKHFEVRRAASLLIETLQQISERQSGC
jgi:glycosyltransferase involved in cell wall biosynthesis